jgi:hypothetical protein
VNHASQGIAAVITTEQMNDVIVTWDISNSPIIAENHGNVRNAEWTPSEEESLMNPALLVRKEGVREKEWA